MLTFGKIPTVLKITPIFSTYIPRWRTIQIHFKNRSCYGPTLDTREFFSRTARCFKSFACCRSNEWRSRAKSLHLKKKGGGRKVTSQLETANLPCSEAGRFPVAWNKFRTRWKRRTPGHICKLEVFMDV